MKLEDECLWRDRAHEFLAYFWQGFSTAEIAEMFGVESRVTVAEMILEYWSDAVVRRIYSFSPMPDMMHVPPCDKRLRTVLRSLQ